MRETKRTSKPSVSLKLGAGALTRPGKRDQHDIRNTKHTTPLKSGGEKKERWTVACKRPAKRIRKKCGVGGEKMTRKRQVKKRRPNQGP